MEEDKIYTSSNQPAEKRELLIYIVIIVILFISGFVSFSLLKNNKTLSIPFTTQTTQNVQPTVISPTPNLNTPVNYPGDKIDAANEKYYVKEAFRKAENADEVDIGECLPIPQIAKFSENATVTIHNSNTQDHVIRLSPTISYTIPARSQIEIKADFGKGEGIYYYNCDDSSLPAGMFIVENS